MPERVHSFRERRKPGKEEKEVMVMVSCLSLSTQYIKTCLHSTRINYSTNYMHIEI